MKTLYKLYSMAMLAAMAGITPPHQKLCNFTSEQREEIRKRRDQRLIEIKKTRGMQEFDIDGYTVLALNKKNAIRKVNQLKSRLL